jgi:broad specificity phosphatase PhoE
MTTPLTTIYLIRHGEVHNPQDIYYGRCPHFHLSEKGRAQAQAAAAVLAGQPIGVLYSSPLLRARQTAREIGAPHGRLEPRVSRLLLETKLPYDGQSNEGARAINWDLFRAIGSEYEQPGDVLRRMRRFLNRVRRQHPGKHVAVVSHHHPILFTTLWALGKPVDLGYRAERTNLGLPERFPIQCAIVKFTFQTPSDVELPACTVL